MGSNLKTGKVKSCGCLQNEFEDLSGQKFGKLEVVKFYEKRKRKTGTGYRIYWLCKCDCGEYTVTESDSLKNGKSKSCGCSRVESITKHGMRFTRLYNIWHGIKDRCLCENATGYKDYGGRGIKVCDEWLDFIPFSEWALENGYNDELTIDRIDVDGNYEPSNCRWADTKTQANNRRNNVIVEYKDKKYTMAELSEKTNIPYRILSRRIEKYETVEEAIDTYYCNENI